MKMTQSEAGKLGAIAGRETQKRLKQERIDKYNLDPTKCKCCDEAFDYEKRMNKFCDKSCSATYNNAKGLIPKKKPLPRANCECGNITVLKNKFCKSCISIGKHIKKI